MTGEVFAGVSFALGLVLGGGVALFSEDLALAPHLPDCRDNTSGEFQWTTSALDDEGISEFLGHADAWDIEIEYGGWLDWRTTITATCNGGAQ